jgi:hypothetical protein
MAVQVYYRLIERAELVGVIVLFIIGAVLIALMPAKHSREVASATAV